MLKNKAALLPYFALSLKLFHGLECFNRGSGFFGERVAQAGKLNQCHGRTIANPRNAKLHNTGISARDVLETRANFIKKLFDAVMAAQNRERPSAGVKSVLQGHGNELVRKNA